MTTDPHYYSCKHGTSNSPDACHLRAWALTADPTEEPAPPQVMPDDWHLSYASVPGGGITDSASFT